MAETAASIAEYGVLVPGIARIRENGGYEIIAGHRRKRGCELAGKTEMPFVVRDYTDEESTIIMVDSNIQREDILPGEKAKAYAMKYEAMKHQGKKSGKNTLDEVGEAAGENAKKVQRYIWLSRLSSVLLEMVDNKKLGFSQGVDISFLTAEAQQWVRDAIEERHCPVSTAQSARLKEYGERGCSGMSGNMDFDYYYGIEAEQFSFYRIPRILIKDERFRGLSSDAKLLYGLMLDRMALSMKNGWLDGQNRAYIYYTLENVMEDLGCCRDKCVKILAELDAKNIQDMELSTALHSLMSIFATGIKNGSITIDETIRMQLIEWFVSQPAFIQAIFPGFIWEIDEHDGDAPILSATYCQ